MLFHYALQSHTKGIESHEHLLIDGECVHLHRETFQAALKLAAKTTGSDVYDFGSSEVRLHCGPRIMILASSRDGDAGLLTHSISTFGKTTLEQMVLRSPWLAPTVTNLNDFCHRP